MTAVWTEFMISLTPLLSGEDDATADATFEATLRVRDIRDRISQNVELLDLLVLKDPLHFVIHFFYYYN